MLARYREVVNTVLAYRDAKEKLVRGSLTSNVDCNNWSFGQSL